MEKQNQPSEVDNLKLELNNLKVQLGNLNYVKSLEDESIFRAFLIHSVEDGFQKLTNSFDNLTSKIETLINQDSKEE